MAALTDNITRIAAARSLRAVLAGLEDDLVSLLGTAISDSAGFLVFEQAAEALGRRLSDGMVEARIRAAHESFRGRQEACKEARERLRAAGAGPGRIDNLGPRPASVRLPGGTVLRMATPYIRPCRRGLVGRPRTKRGPDGSGAYPVMEKYGIRDGVTPLVRSKISRQIVQCGSYAEAQDQLRSDGLDVDISTMVRVAAATGKAALDHRDAALARALEAPLPERSLIEGRRLRVSIDGGRARTRCTFTERRKRKNGRRAFEVPWREPRLITVDVLTDDAKLDPTVPPIYEVDLGDADRVFELLAGLLRYIGAHLATEVMFVSDGADWIWDRTDELIRRAGLDPDRVHLILDFYHASEHVFAALKACKNLSDDERRAKYKDLRRKMLKPDGVEVVITVLSALARGRRAKAVNKEIRYLRQHAIHMRYAQWKAARVPIGSGVVESAIRRVINLRFKAASMFWREDHLAAFLYLRCVLKAGRWEEFMVANLQGQHWVVTEVETGAPCAEKAA